MTAQLPHSRRRRELQAQGLPDFGAIALGDNPARTIRILGLVRAGHTYGWIIAYGHAQHAWAPYDVDRVLRENRITLPDPPEPRPHSNKPTSAQTTHLTTRQIQICHHLCQAMTEAEIAETLGATPETIHNHIQQILRETGRRDKLALVVDILAGKLAPIQLDP